MVKEKIKENWNKLLEEGYIRFFPEQNEEMICNGGKMPFCIGYVPERMNRIQKGVVKEHPLGDNIVEREDCLYSFDRLAILANNRPVERYHSILCSKAYIPQNEFTEAEITEVSKIVEETGIRSFLNMVGAAATLNHFHTQVLLHKFNIEDLYKEYFSDNIGYLPDYPAGNILFSGELSKRVSLLFEILSVLSKSDLPYTIKDNGTISDQHLFTLLFWEDNILLVPRKKETPDKTKAMAGGLELSGHFLITNPLAKDNVFEGVNEETMLDSIREVSFKQEDIKFLCNKFNLES